MPRKPKLERDHVWILAITLKADNRTTARANRVGRIKLDVDSELDVIDAYCFQCRRTYDDVAGQPCEAAESNEHLIGGPKSSRRRRIHDHDCRLFGCLITEAEAEALRRAASNAAIREQVG